MKKPKKEEPPKDAKDPKAFFGSMGSKKFGRSDKSLTTVKPKKQKIAGKDDDKDLFDELDDFDVDTVPMDVAETEAEPASKKPSPKKQKIKDSPKEKSSPKKKTNFCTHSQMWKLRQCQKTAKKSTRKSFCLQRGP